MQKTWKYSPHMGRKKPTETLSEKSGDIRLTRQKLEISYFKYVRRTKETLYNGIKESIMRLSH